MTRVVSVIDGGRILNEKTATSQIIGGTVGGIGMALFEDTVTDAGTGRIAAATATAAGVAVTAKIAGRSNIDNYLAGLNIPATAGWNVCGLARRRGVVSLHPGRHRAVSGNWCRR